VDDVFTLKIKTEESSKLKSKLMKKGSK